MSVKFSSSCNLQLQVTGADVVPFNPEKQNLLMHVLHELHQGLGWGDQYFRFGRIQENAAKSAARIQIINMRVSVAAGLHEVGSAAHMPLSPHSPLSTPRGFRRVYNLANKLI